MGLAAGATGTAAQTSFPANPQPVTPSRTAPYIPGSERIIDYRVVLQINRDATLTVTETIKVFAAGLRIRRGIYRQIPTEYRGSLNRRISIGFTVQKVLRDGKPEPWHLRPWARGKAVYIGDSGTLLPRNRTYTYTLVWQTRRALGFFEKHDELYWNAIAHGWRFRIEQATVTVRLPPGVKPLKYQAWTGRRGVRGQAYEASLDVNGNPVFKTTRPLNPREGLTVFVSFPKGIVAEPGFWTRLGWWLEDSTGAVTALIGLGLGLVYFFVAWILVGRDPARGTVIPRFHPPKGFSPAACRFVMRMGFDDRSFAAAIVSMAVKGYLRIEDLGDKTYKLHRTGEDMSALSAGEKAVARKLFAFGRSSIHMKKENHATFSGAKDGLKGALANDFEAGFFRRNVSWHLAGFAITGLTGLALAIHAGGEAFLFVAMFVFLAYLAAGLGLMAVQKLRFGQIAAGGLLALVTVGPFLVGVGFLASAVADALSWLAVFLLLGLIVAHLLFEIFVKAPTSDGRRVMDEIEGLKMYMTVAEKDRLERLNPPDRTPALFERLLPYALALDVENQWSEQFAGVLAKAGAGAQDGYAPAWYYGAHSHGFNAGRFGSDLGSTFTSAVGSAATAPGSSSGGGGGGFSGGGGGGGGGGGW